MSIPVRKISVGPDYKNAMNYVVGQEVFGGRYVIDSIIKNHDGSFTIWIKNKKGEIQKWKVLNQSMPIVEEHIVDPLEQYTPS
jgi:hypothetical protein